MLSFTTRFKKIQLTLKKRLIEHLFTVLLRNAEPPDEETARGVIDKLFFSDKRYDLGEVGRYRINKKFGISHTPMEIRVLTKEDMIPDH